MADQKELQYLRPLGTFEHFRAVLHDLGFHYNVALSAQYSHESQTLDLTRLYRVLGDVIARMPALGVTIRGLETAEPYFARLAGVNLDQVVRWIEKPVSVAERDSLLDEILSTENSNGFDVTSSDPLWRVVVLKPTDHRVTEHHQGQQKTDVIFIWHHAIGDGHSGLAVLRAVLGALDASTSQDSNAQTNALDPSSQPLCFVPSSILDLAPALETLLSMPSSMRTKIRRASLTYFGDWSKKTGSKKWSGGNYQNAPPIRTLIQHIRILSSDADYMKQQCHSENTSITAFLQTLLGNILFQCFADADRLMCATAISLRRFIPSTEYNIDDMTMGMWVSAFHIEYAPSAHSMNSSTFDWDRARKNRERIRKEIAKGETDIETGALRGIADFRENLLGKVGNERQDSFAVTNLGVVKSSPGGDIHDTKAEYSTWKIADVVFSQSCHVNGSAIQFCIISTENGDMVISLSSQEGVVAQKDLDKIARLLQNKLSNSNKADNGRNFEKTSPQ